MRAEYKIGAMVNLNSLNPQQRAAVETLRGPVLILAGAGTGKTRVITSRIAHMIDRGISPENILGVTFTNKAAREMQERVSRLMPWKSRSPALDQRKDTRPTLCTFHSLCVRILRQHIEKLGYKRSFVIYDESEQLSTVKKILSHISDKAGKVDAAKTLAMLSRYRNGGNRAAIFQQSAEGAMAAHINRHYESALRACNAVDFDDLILLTLRLFREHPDSLHACRQKYQYVMVDEYQDTNASQFELVHALTCEHRNLCVVGDDDQSIYGWRGAEISNLLDMEKHYSEVKVIKLEQNYRSTTTILNAANAVIKRNARRRGKNLWSGKGQGVRIALHTFKDEEDEARSVVEQIELARMARRVPWAQQAILFRTNAQSRPLETALRKANVRYHLIGGQSFFDRREIRDVLAYFKTILNPNDDVSILRIANVPARGLSDVTMGRLLAASQERKCSVYAALKNPVVIAAFQKTTRECLERWGEWIDETRAQIVSKLGSQCPGALSKWAEQMIESIGYFQDLRRGEKTPEAAENRVRNVREMISNLDSPETLHLPAIDRLENYLEQVTLDQDRAEEKDPGDAVTLITMHSCKGLEFPHVYIVGLEEGLLPHERSKVEDTLDEERRLFYVAITRAMETLALSHCLARRKYGSLVHCSPSQFLGDLPPDLVEDGSAQAGKPVAVDSGKTMFEMIRSSL